MNFIPGPMELVIILIIVAMLFGVGRLPEVFGAVGRGLREFRKEASDLGSAPTTPPAQPQPPAKTEVVTPESDVTNP
ncbi:MAG: twin-arginine translocase TatA/TatE family subunit [Caldilineaceae bacterium]|nr:twin-arginine translocase TatA/TatE family subunit [Caldilineaceae bacterium]